MMTTEANLLQQGAEAKLFSGDFYGLPAVTKERFVKAYRHPELDARLSRDRMKSEVKSLLRCRRAGVRVPAVLLVDLAGRRLCLERLEPSITVREFVTDALALAGGPELLNVRTTALDKVSHKLGGILADMHAANIIHGDLTTSNMLLMLQPQPQPQHPEPHPNSCPLPQWTGLALIDFGLSYISAEVEDKAVDLYVLERAFLSSHPNTETQFALVLDAYRKCSKQGKIVLRKLDEVRTRGRKRLMIG